MAKKSMIARDAKRKRLNEKNKDKIKSFKKIIYSSNSTLEEKFSAQISLSRIPRDSFECRQRNRCFLTGRPRGYYRKFGLSRIALRELAAFALVPGIKKSSW